MRSHGKDNRGFTLIELLTVVAVISTIVGILTVGQRKVKIVAMNLRQKAAFHAFDIGLSVFAEDFDGFPSSESIDNGGSSQTICGAQRMAEALLGRDENGFDVASQWHPDDTDEPDYIYTDQKESMYRRKTPYVTLERCGIYTIADLWGSHYASSEVYTSDSVSTNLEAPVITDVFRRNIIDNPDGSGGTIKVGTPILYFKANQTPSREYRMYDGAEYPNYPNTVDYDFWTFNFKDNIEILKLPWLREVDNATYNTTSGLESVNYLVDNNEDGTDDDGKTNAERFYEETTRKVRDIGTTSGGTKKMFSPYHPNRFLFISAGWDGKYGTKDDVTNFMDLD